VSPDGKLVAKAKSVPELTRIRDIKLNARVSLRCARDAVASLYRILSPSGPTVAKPSVDHVPAGGFVFMRR
jgi:hypothetical protein